MTIQQFINFINRSEELILSDHLVRLFRKRWLEEWRKRGLSGTE